MGSSITKVSCMWLPAQSGKTRKCEESISQELNREDELRRLIDVNGEVSDDEKQQILNIIICSNNRALVNQTTQRMKKNVYDKISESNNDEFDLTNFINDDDNINESEIDSDEKIINEVFAWHSGLKNNRMSPGDLTLNILEEFVKMVIICANKIRLKYLYEIINRLENTRLFTGKINIWIDEADETIKLWNQSCFNQIISFKKVSKITLISATFNNVIKQFGKLKVIPYAEPYSKETYHKTNDSQIIEENYVISKKNSSDYLSYIINKYENELCRPGVRLFAPGNTDKRSHDEIATFLKRKRFIVVKINSTEKVIIHPNGGNKIDLNDYLKTENPVEIGRILSDIYISNQYFNYPYAITGLNCLGRGITFNDDKFIFTHGIIPPILNKATVYQVCSRTNGNIKHLSNYLIPRLYMTSSTKDKIFEQENLAINISMYVYEKYQQNETYDGIITNEDLKDINDADGERDKMNVPVKVEITDDEFNEIKIKSQGHSRKNFILEEIISNKNRELYEKLKNDIYNYECIQCTIPNTDNSYKKHITDAIKKLNKNEKFKIDIHGDDKHKNSYQFFIDSRSVIKSIIIIIYDGNLDDEL
jgi:hypothetical protein